MTVEGQDTYPLKNSAILDSGTTIHVFNNPNRFHNLTLALPGDFLWAGDTQLSIHGYGYVDIQINGIRRSRILRLFDVALCPSILCNLVSLRQLRKEVFCGIISQEVKQPFVI